MKIPIALIAIPQQETTNTIFRLRKELFEKGYLYHDELDTVPHLTIAVNYEFDEEKIDSITKKILNYVQNRNVITLNNLRYHDINGSIAAEFDLSLTADLINNFESILGSSFKPIRTWYVKILRKVKSEYANQAIEATINQLPTHLIFNKICLAGKQLRGEDIIWETSLKSTL